MNLVWQPRRVASLGHTKKTLRGLPALSVKKVILSTINRNDVDCL